MPIILTFFIYIFYSYQVLDSETLMIFGHFEFDYLDKLMPCILGILLSFKSTEIETQGVVRMAKWSSQPIFRAIFDHFSRWLEKRCAFDHLNGHISRWKNVWSYPGFSLSGLFPKVKTLNCPLLYKVYLWVCWRAIYVSNSWCSISPITTFFGKN